MEMKNICGKIPIGLHEKLKLESRRVRNQHTKIFTMVIEEHFNREKEKEISMGAVRTVAVQVSEELFSRD